MMKTIKRQKIYDGKVIKVFNDKVQLQNGKTAYREVVEHFQVSAIVAVDDENKVIIEKQYRYPIGKEIYEIPAGLIDEGETPIEAAKRELLEETGYAAESWQEITSFYPSAGMHDELVHIFLAKGIKKVAEQQLDNDEVLSFELMDLDELLKKIGKKEIVDGKTVVGLLMYGNMANYL